MIGGRVGGNGVGGGGGEGHPVWGTHGVRVGWEDIAVGFLITGVRSTREGVWHYIFLSRDMNCTEPVLEGLLLEVEEAGVGDAFQGGVSEDLDEGLVVEGKH